MHGCEKEGVESNSRIPITIWLKLANLVALGLIVSSTPESPFDGAASSLGPKESMPAPAYVLEPSTSAEIYLQKQAAKENLLTDPASRGRLRYQKEIEEKYGIVLLTMQQVYGSRFNELDSSLVPTSPPVRWSSEQLKLYDELFSHLPSTLYKPINGVDLKLFQATLLSTECECAGGSYGKSGVINVSETTDRERAFSYLIHELTHRLNALTEDSLKTGVKAIIGDRLQELHTEEGFILENTKPGSFESETILSLVDTDIDKPTLGKSNIYNHRQIGEGVAQLSQMYIKGYEQFMLSLGSILDGNGKSVKEIDASASLAENFPKTQELYDLYRKEVFGGLEYDLGKRKFIELGSVATLKMADDYLNLRKMLDSIEQNYGIKIEAEGNTIFPGGIGEKKLHGILEALPRDFYSPDDGREMTIYFKQGRQEGREFNYSEFQDRIILRMDNFFLNQSQTIINDRSSQTYLNPIDDIANNLSRRRDAATGYQTRDNIMGILGGEVFLNSPKAIYPELEKIRGPHDPYAGAIYSLFYQGDLPNHVLVRNPAEIVGRLGVLYIQGWEKFSESLKPFLNPIKIADIYNEIRKLYQGVEYTGLDQGIPVRR